MNFREQIEEVKPREIEERSFAIISEELGARTFAPHTELIVKRCIHTSADFDYADNLCFSQDAAVKAMEAIQRGVSVVTDTNMAKAGINKVSLGKYGGSVHCFMADADVAEAARLHGTTRASESMKKAAAMGEPFLYAIGNAPTALVTLYDLMQEGQVKPELIIGVPVGFVNVVESKRHLFAVCEKYHVPAIVAMGRKGGSNVAAAICNALVYSAAEMLDPKARGWH